MTGMTTIVRALIVSALAVAILGGCTETQFPEATGKGTINALNAMPASPGVGFLIEERFLGSVGYKETLGAQAFDDLSYNFNFQFTALGETEATRFATQFVDMVADTDYTLVLTGSVTAPIVTQWERPEREFEGSETVFELAIAHLSPALEDVDVYVALTGTAPVLGEERAKVSFGDTMPAIDLESDNYEVIITARDDPATILYQSHETFFAARISHTIGIFDADPSIVGNISVRMITIAGLDIELPDANFLPTLRTVHAAFGTENFDIYRDADFTAPIFSDLGFGESTGDLPVMDGAVTYTYTSVGNPGAIIDEQDQLITLGSRTSTVVAGMPGMDLTRIIQVDDRRSIETHAKLRFINAAANFATLDLYLVQVGTDINDVGPLISGMAFGFSSDFVASLSGNFELTLTLPGEKNPISAAVPVDLVNGDVVEAMILDTVDPAIVESRLTIF